MADVKPPSYFRVVWSRAYRDTKRFWTAHRTATTVGSPLLAAASWSVFREWTGWADLVPVAVVSILILIALMLLTFLVSFFLAPAGLYSDLQARVSELESKQEKRWPATASPYRDSIREQAVE